MLLFKSDKGTGCGNRNACQLNHIQIRSLVWIKTPLFIVAGGFANNNYWSSTENNANNAWNQNFDNGNQNNDNKDNNNRVRCVRGF
jgi:hypothetical protein